MFSDKIGDVRSRLGTVWAWKTKGRSTELRFEQHRLSTREANAIGHSALIDDYRIQTWALEEARRRLEAEGILPDPDDEAKKQT